MNLYENNTGLPSTTDIISFFNKDIAAYYTEASRLRGTMVHYICELYLDSLFIVETNIDNGIMPYYHSFKKWALLMVQEVISVEQRLTDSEGVFCGKYDMVVRLKGDSKNTLIDIKTSSQVLKSHRLQTASYRHLAIENDIKVDRHGILRVRKNGGIAIFDEFLNYESDLKLFFDLLDRYYIENSLVRGFLI